MKKLLLVFALTVSSTAFADHSLRTAMNDSNSIKTAVDDAMNDQEVTCDLDHSLEMKPTLPNAQVRQVTFCYEDAIVMTTANAVLTSGNALGGIYGLSVTSILDVEYSQNAKTGKYDKIISLSLK